MYSYYFLSALGPSLQPYLGWKHLLTKLQMVQFLVFILHAIQPLFIECDYPKVGGRVYYDQARLYRGKSFRFTVGSSWATAVFTSSFLPIFTLRLIEVGKGRQKLQRKWTDLRKQDCETIQNVISIMYFIL